MLLHSLLWIANNSNVSSALGPGIVKLLVLPIT